MLTGHGYLASKPPGGHQPLGPRTSAGGRERAFEKVFA